MDEKAIRWHRCPQCSRLWTMRTCSKECRPNEVDCPECVEDVNPTNPPIYQDAEIIVSGVAGKIDGYW